MCRKSLKNGRKKCERPRFEHQISKARLNGSCKKRFVQETVRARNGSFERAMQKNMIDPTQFLQEIIEYAVAVRAEHIDESGAID